MRFKIYLPNKLNILDEIISDVEKDLIDEFLFWSPIEYYFPGEGNFNDEGKSFNKLLNLVSQKNITFYALFGAPSYQNFYDKDRTNNIKILGWPTSLLHYSDGYMKNVDTQNKLEKLFICLNRRSHTHRAILIDSIFKNDLFKYGDISWRQQDTFLNQHIFEYWKETEMKINEDENKFFFNSNCFLNLVSESNSEKFFFTEKTFKPILGEQAFLCYGFPNQNSYLKNFGFELYDEIFDYGFDSDSLLENRVDGIIENLNNIKNQDPKELYELVKEKIQYNKNNAISILKNDFYISTEIRILFNKHKEYFFEFQNKNEDKMMDILIDLLVR